jgi:hypothetical protein
MKHLFIHILSLIVFLAAAQAEPKLENPGQPFNQINERLDETNVKIETVKSGLDDIMKGAEDLRTGQDDLKKVVKETKDIAEETKDIAEETHLQVEEMHDTISGSCNWVSPYWSIREWGEYWKDYTTITIYNPIKDPVEWTTVYIIVENQFGMEIHRESLPAFPSGWSVRREVESMLSEPLFSSGSIRIESYDEILVEGEILTIFESENGYVGSHSRTMTWYPVKGDCL